MPRDFPTPSPEAMRAGEIVESRHYDFKREIDLDSEKARMDLVDDAVAFLNADGGHIVIGVEERKGIFHDFRPLTGDADKVRLRIQEIMRSNIDPTPRIEARPIPIEGGFLIDVHISEHRLRPYQNKARGSFHVRVGAQNQKMTRTEVRQAFAVVEEMKSDLERFFERGILSYGQLGMMDDGGAVISIGILPAHHYDETALPLDQVPFKGLSKRNWLQNRLIVEPGSGVIPFSCGSGGFVAHNEGSSGKPIFHVVVTDDWYLHASLAHPYVIRHGRPDEDRLTREISEFAAGVQNLFDECEVKGPVAVAAKVTGLLSDVDVGSRFRADEVNALAPGRPFERLADANLPEAVVERLRNARWR